MREPVSPKLRVLLALALVASLLPLLWLTEADLQRRKLSGRSVTGEHYYLPPAGMLRTLCFGYNELAADLIWVRTISYFTDHFNSDRDLAHLHRYLKTIVALDSHVPAVYRFGSSMLTGVPGGNKPLLHAIELLEVGHRALPENHQLPFKIGLLYMSELKTKDPAQRRRWRLKGARWLHRAILLGADEPWLPALAAQVLTKEGERQMAIRQLEEIYLVTQDPETRHQIASKLIQMRARGIGERLRSATQRLNELQRKSRIPFVSSDLYVLLRPPAE